MWTLHGKCARNTVCEDARRIASGVMSCERVLFADTGNATGIAVWRLPSTRTGNHMPRNCLRVLHVATDEALRCRCVHCIHGVGMVIAVSNDQPLFNTNHRFI